MLGQEDVLDGRVVVDQSRGVVVKVQELETSVEKFDHLGAVTWGLVAGDNFYQ